MGDITEVTGMVISTMNVGEYDRRIVLLTKERGKISAFAKGARRPNSQLMGVTRTFVFGKFWLYEGRSSYNIKQASITNYFQNIIEDYDAVLYACYFAELTDYYGREGLDASAMINLLYVSFKALVNKNIPNRLVKNIFELRLIAQNGECPDMFVCQGCGTDACLDKFSMRNGGMLCDSCGGEAADKIRLMPDTVYALQYIVTAPLERLFTFTVSSEVLMQLTMVLKSLCDETFDKPLKSLEMLEML